MTSRNFKNGLGISTVGACVGFDNVTVTSCTNGLQLVESYLVDVDLAGIVISANETGVEITAGSADNILRDGSVSGNSGNGIVVEASNVAPNDNLITDMQIENNGLNGIAILGGDGNQVVDCTISGNNHSTPKTGYGGIVLHSCSAEIKWNYIEDRR